MASETTTTSPASAEKDALISLYNNKLIKYSLTGNSDSKDGNEIIDIVSSYPWTTNTLKTGNNSASSATYQHTIPFCYIIEHKQTVNSNIMNVLNIWKAGIDVIGNNAAKIAQGAANAAEIAEKAVVPNSETKPTQQITREQNNTRTTGNQSDNNNNQGGKSEHPDNNRQKEESTVASLITSVAEPLINGIDNVKSFYEKQLSKWTAVESGHLNTNVLAPYKYLYLTEKTGKKYVFPMLTPTNLLDISSSWGEGKAGGFKIGSFDITDAARQSIEVIQTLANVADLFSGQGGSIETAAMEMAKAFNFDSNGPSITTNFVLFNTIKKDAWKKNFRFLSLFLLRNLPFKVTAYSFVPPLLYDVIVPGVRHLPLCYVSNIRVTSHGKIRQLTTTNYIKDLIGEGVVSDTTLVPVPEAWGVEITFTCLLSNTANLMLDLANIPINISTTSINA